MLTQADEKIPITTITLHDIRALCQIVEVCCQRGSIRPEEMAGVGTLYDKTMTFLTETGFFNANKEPASAEQPAEPVSQAEQPAPSSPVDPVLSRGTTPVASPELQ